MNGEEMNIWKLVVAWGDEHLEVRCGLLGVYYSGIHLHRLIKTTQNLNQDSW